MICKRCKLEAPDVRFRKYRRSCTSCDNKDLKEWRKENTSKLKDYRRQRYLLNKESEYESNKLWVKKNKKLRREQLKSFYLKNKEVLKTKRNLKYKTVGLSVEQKLAKVLRNRLLRALDGKYKRGSAVLNLGCSIEDFKLYLESMFKSGMTWKNHGRTGWHIDHIKPLLAFDLNDPKELKKACHFKNMQPLWFAENIRKSNKY